MASDLISRDELLEDLRESKAELERILEGSGEEMEWRICEGKISAFAEVIMRVKAAPAVDAVEVVRCRDCAYIDVPRCCPCQFSGFEVTGDWYCPMGVKKDAVD